MAEAKAGKATAFGQRMFCLECGRELLEKYDEADGPWYYQHHFLGGCPNAGKRFKVKTVELEEL
jgi:hypothetical protein